MKFNDRLMYVQLCTSEHELIHLPGSSTSYINVVKSASALSLLKAISEGRMRLLRTPPFLLASLSFLHPPPLISSTSPAPCPSVAPGRLWPGLIRRLWLKATAADAAGSR